MGPTLIFAANSAWNLLNFRLPVMRKLKNCGYHVVAAVPGDREASELENMGFAVHHVRVDARGLSPLRDAALIHDYWKMFREVRPAAFLGFTAKPNIYGSIAARLSGIPAVNTITGLGTGFLSGKALEWIVMGLYRLGLGGSGRVFFHNEDDLDLFVRRSLVKRERAEIVPGSGVDLSHFTPAPSSRRSRTPTFLFVGRLLKDKGALEFAEAAAIVRRDHAARFTMVGGLEDHPKAVPKRSLQPFIDNGSVEMAGPVKDVRPFIADSDCVVLPSYREGLPRVILEASSMAKPAICTNVPGCRQAIEDGITGLLCDARSAASLAEAITAMIRMSPSKRRAMGVSAREKAEREFSQELVAEAYLRALESLGIRAPTPGALKPAGTPRRRGSNPPKAG